MEDNNDGQRAKRQREVQPTVADILLVARRMWQRRNPHQRSTAQQEDRDFRESFGCGPFVALTAWNLLCSHGLLPPNGTIEHLLWTLSFLKSYGKTLAHKAFCGGQDAQTIRKWVWLFIEALSDLEPSLVSIYYTLRCPASCQPAINLHTSDVLDCLGEQICKRPRGRLFDICWLCWFCHSESRASFFKPQVQEKEWPPIWNCYLHSNWNCCVD